MAGTFWYWVLRRPGRADIMTDCSVFSEKQRSSVAGAAAFCVVLVAVVLVAGCIGGDNSAIGSIGC